MKYLATSIMHVESSMTIMPPEPMMEPAALRLSYEMGRSNFEAGMQPPAGPPVCTALIFLFPGAPPPMSRTTWFMVMPIGTSTRPVFLILPTRLKIFVPELPSVPLSANCRAPVETMIGMFAQVSTLLIIVGLP